MLDAYMAALNDASAWQSYVGSLLGMIQWRHDWEDIITEEDRPLFDEIDQRYVDQAEKDAADARECRDAIERANSSIAARATLSNGRDGNG